MDLDAYIAEHSGEWNRLEQLSRRRTLQPAETDELLMLYQRASTHLSMVRSRTPDPLLVAWLSQLVLQARSRITGVRTGTWRSIGKFFTEAFPAAVYLAWRWWAGVTVVCVIALAIVISFIANHPEIQTQLMPAEQIDLIVNHSFENYYSEYQNASFALSVWLNNARIAGISLVAGILIIPTLFMLWQNILNIGIMGGIMIGNGRADLYFGLIAPHGLLELSSIFLAAGVGLRIGWAWIAPRRDRTRGQSVAEAGRSGIVVALGLVCVLAIAGLLEGFVTPNFDAPIAIPIGVIAFAAFVTYIVVVGRHAVARGVTGDLPNEMKEARPVS